MVLLFCFSTDIKYSNQIMKLELNLSGGSILFLSRINNIGNFQSTKA